MASSVDFERVIRHLRHYKRFLPSYADIVIDTSRETIDYANDLPRRLWSVARLSIDPLVAAVDEVQRATHRGKNSP